MTKQTVRGYTVALSLLGFTGAWTAIAGDPWPSAPASTAQTVAADDPRIAALDAREAALRRRAADVQRIVATRTAQAAQPPPVRIVTLPPVTQTTSS